MRAIPYRAARAGVLRLAQRSISREEFFATLCILSLANSFALDVADYLFKHGPLEAILNTFGISAILWFASYLGVSLIVRENGGEVNAVDLVFGAGALLLILIPSSAPSKLALTILSLHLLVCSEDRSPQWRGAIVLLATTLPLLWSPLLFQSLSKFILQIDASLVARALGTVRHGNLVRFADDSGYLVIYPGCSSLKNLSLTFLCWVVVAQAVKHRRTTMDPLWCGLACLSVIAVNVIRISLMGLSEWHYGALHNEFAGAIFNTVELALALGFSVLGMRREIFSRV